MNEDRVVWLCHDAELYNAIYMKLRLETPM